MKRCRKKVRGVGINDADYATERKGSNGERWTCPYYRVWDNLIIRCYSHSKTKKTSNYRDCEMSDDWKYFSRFKRWMEQQDWEDKQLDKDILKPCNKIYAEDYCVFVPRKVNNLLVLRRNCRGGYPLGVYWHKHTGKFLAQCSNGSGKQEYLGLFESPQEAHEVWRQRKHELALKYAEDQTDQRVAYALRQWFKPNGWYLKLEENK